MLKRYWPGAALLAVLLVAAMPTLGQDKPVTDEQQALQDQIQQTFQQIIQNMIAKGMDPRQFFQQMQNGTDPADIAKQLVDQGVIDQASLTQLQTNVQKLTTGRLRDQLDVSDAEWTVLDPLIRKVMTAQAALQRASGFGGGGGRSGMMTGFTTIQTPAGVDLSRAMRSLHAALDSKNASAEEIAAALNTFRDARTRALADLTAAQRDLTSAVTARQEGVLVRLGILE